MSEITFKPRGRYFEEFIVGDIMVTSGRTITEADVVNFAGLSGDYNQIHTDAQFSANYLFGKRIAHGLLVQVIASGLAVQTGMVEGTVLAFRELTTKFSKPIFIGDTIHVVLEITNTKKLRRLGGGNVTMSIEILNQEDEAVQRGSWVMLVKSKEEVK